MTPLTTRVWALIAGWLLVAPEFGLAENGTTTVVTDPKLDYSSMILTDAPFHRPFNLKVTKIPNLCDVTLSYRKISKRPRFPRFQSDREGFYTVETANIVKTKGDKGAPQCTEGYFHIGPLHPGAYYEFMFSNNMQSGQVINSTGLEAEFAIYVEQMLLSEGNDLEAEQTKAAETLKNLVNRELLKQRLSINKKVSATYDELSTPAKYVLEKYAKNTVKTKRIDQQMEKNQLEVIKLADSIFTDFDSNRVILPDDAAGKLRKKLLSQLTPGASHDFLLGAGTLNAGDFTPVYGSFNENTAHIALEQLAFVRDNKLTYDAGLQLITPQQLAQFKAEILQAELGMLTRLYRVSNYQNTDETNFKTHLKNLSTGLGAHLPLLNTLAASCQQQITVHDAKGKATVVAGYLLTEQKVNRLVAQIHKDGGYILKNSPWDNLITLAAQLKTQETDTAKRAKKLKTTLSVSSDFISARFAGLALQFKKGETTLAFSGEDLGNIKLLIKRVEERRTLYRSKSKVTPQFTLEDKMYKGSDGKSGKVYTGYAKPTDMSKSDYLSIDFGYAYGFDYKKMFPYTGVNLYFMPINKNIPLSVYSDELISEDWWLARTSLLIGLSPVKSTTPEGKAQSVPGYGNMMVGLGFRFSSDIKLNLGTIAYQETDSPKTRQPLTYENFWSISFDWNFTGDLTKMKNYISDD